jgi:hypothetical protein
LHVAFLDSIQQRGFKLSRDGEEVFNGYLAASDTFLLDSGLEPNNSYLYTASRIGGNEFTDSSDLFITTLDTTSHDFIWQIDTLGEGGSNLLRDVYVAGENDVWVVGTLFQVDSTTGQIDPDAYNAAHWDGSSWEIMRIIFPVFCGQPSVFSPEIRGVYGFGSDNIWFTDGGHFVHWDGSQFEIVCGDWKDLGGEIVGLKRMWGSSPNDIYAAGGGGALGQASLAHYDGIGWSAIETGNTSTISDIWGGADLRGESVILCATSDIGQAGRAVLKLNGTTLIPLSDNGLGQILGGLWFVSDMTHYVVGDGLYAKHDVEDSSPWQNFQPGLTQYGMSCVRGSGVNDVMVFGSFGNNLHYNGVSWRNLHNQTFLDDGSFVNVDVRGDFLVAVGLNRGKGVVLFGWHQ